MIPHFKAPIELWRERSKKKTKVKKDKEKEDERAREENEQDDRKEGLRGVLYFNRLFKTMKIVNAWEPVQTDIILSTRSILDMQSQNSSLHPLRRAAL